MVRAITLGVLLFCASPLVAQIGTSPSERRFPSGTSSLMPSVIQAPLHLSEVDVWCDREAALLRGDVHKVRLTMVECKDGQRPANAVESVSEYEYDECGNLTSAREKVVSGGKFGLEILYAYEPAYEDGGCVRTGVRSTISSGSQSREAEGEFARTEDGELVAALYGISGVRIDREAESGVVVTYEGGPMPGLADEFDRETGRVRSSKTMLGTFEFEWLSDREYVVSTRGSPMYKNLLDDHENLVESAHQGSQVVRIGKLHTREYKYDDRGNWTEMLVLTAKELGDPPVLHQVFTREITYRGDDAGESESPVED